MRRCCVCLLILLVMGKARAFSLLTYNVGGNGSTNWSTNTAQAQAIGRQLQVLRPDIVTFNEIPYTNTWQMMNWVTAFMPGYYLATNSATDGFIRSVVASRFPITRSKSWLHSSDLNPFGYTNANFTRDLFEAEIDVPGFAQHVHVFVTHLKAFSDSSSASKRAAEASAISNFFVTNFLPVNAQHAYVLCGDMNEDIDRPPSTSGHPLERIVNAATGLQIITPTNSVTGKEFTYSSASPSERIDYILPSVTLVSNLVSSQVFRSSVLTPIPAPLQQFDDKTSSDHLPVLATFEGSDPPLKLASVVSNQIMQLTWNATTQRSYAVEMSTNLSVWKPLVTNLLATSTNVSWTGGVTTAWQAFRVYRVP